MFNANYIHLLYNTKIAGIQEKYIEGLKSVFEENKVRCGYPNASLSIV